MASKDGKSAYDALLEDTRKLTEDVRVPQEDEFSLEAILAEYGESREQKILEDVEHRAAQAEKGPDGETPAPPRGDAAAAVAASAPEPAQESPAPPEMPPEQELPAAPKPVSMETVVSRTVSAVMEEQELLPEKKQKRRRGLFSRREYVETEELYQRPETPPKDDSEPPGEPEPPEEPEFIGPEVPLGEAAADNRANAGTLRRPLLPAAVATIVLTALVAAAERGIPVPGWLGNETLQRWALLAGLVLVGVLCRSVFIRGFGLLIRRRCSGELLIALSAIAAAADCVTSPLLGGRSSAAPYAVVACAALTFAQWGAYRTARAKFDTYRTAAMTEEPPYLVTGTPHGACKQPGHTEGFYTDAVKPDLPLSWQTALLPVILAASVVFAGLASLGRGRGEDFLLCWSAVLSASASFALPLCWALPWSRFARQLQRNGCAVAGWAGAEAICEKKAIILTDTDLFPPGTVRMNGIKVFGEELPHAVSYAASMVRASGSGLVRLFDEQVRSENGACYPVDDFSFYEEGGCSGTICGESVLLGTMSFMRKMDVRLPGNLNLRTGLFLAVDRQLTAVFAVKYLPAENVDWALKILRRNHIASILAARDANVTPGLLKRKFSKGVRVEYPGLAARLALSEQEMGRGRPRALLLREGLLPYAETVAGSRRLVRAVRGCTVLALLGSAAGTLLAFYLSFLGSFSLMTPITVLVFQLLWTLPVLLVSGWLEHL